MSFMCAHRSRIYQKGWKTALQHFIALYISASLFQAIVDTNCIFIPHTVYEETACPEIGKNSVIVRRCDPCILLLCVFFYSRSAFPSCKRWPLLWNPELNPVRQILIPRKNTLPLTRHASLTAQSPYNISNTNPTTSLYIADSAPSEKLDPYAVLMAIIITLPELCRMTPTDQFPAAPISFHYGNASVTLANGMGACGSLTYDDACTTLQGLAGYLTSSNDFHGNDFQIATAGKVVGSGKVQNLQQKY